MSLVVLLVFVFVMCSFFFFSSRRRHTRFDCDWSSDVCSSDLSQSAPVRRSLLSTGALALIASCTEPDGQADGLSLEESARSEERRVGKECRSRWSPDD